MLTILVIAYDIPKPPKGDDLNLFWAEIIGSVDGSPRVRRFWKCQVSYQYLIDLAKAGVEFSVVDEDDDLELKFMVSEMIDEPLINFKDMSVIPYRQTI